MGASQASGIGMALQNRRQQACEEQLARLQAEVFYVARRNLDMEDCMARAREEKHVALQSLTKRMEDSLRTCDTLQHGQDGLARRAEHLEAQQRDRSSAASGRKQLQQQ